MHCAGVVFNTSMKSKKRSSGRPYGRQAKDKTIKSISLEQDVAIAAKKEADRRGMTFSQFIDEFLKTGGKLSAILTSLIR